MNWSSWLADWIITILLIEKKWRAYWFSVALEHTVIYSAIAMNVELLMIIDWNNNAHCCLSLCQLNIHPNHVWECPHFDGNRFMISSQITCWLLFEPTEFQHKSICKSKCQLILTISSGKPFFIAVPNNILYRFLQVFSGRAD